MQPELETTHLLSEAQAILPAFFIIPSVLTVSPHTPPLQPGWPPDSPHIISFGMPASQTAHTASPGSKVPASFLFLHCPAFKSSSLRFLRCPTFYNAALSLLEVTVGFLRVSFQMPSLDSPADVSCSPVVPLIMVRRQLFRGGTPISLCVFLPSGPLGSSVMLAHGIVTN